MFDSRSPWYSGGRSGTDLDAGSSVSLLQSIYGSQVSQLPFSDCDSDADLLATKSDYLPPNLRSSSPVLPQRRLARPKSSPACVIEARERQRRQMTGGEHEATAPLRRPGSAMPRQRPGTASRGRSRVARGRPTSAAVGGRGSVQRPASAAPSHFAGGGGASPKRTRPKTAMGVRSSSSSTVLLDLEEVEEEEEGLAPLIRDTPPVQLTRTPEYFNFWEGKPLLRRDFGVKVHKRKQWQRPRSDYGSRFLSRKRKGDDDEGEGGSGLLGRGLDTVLERADGSELGSESGGTRRGSRDFGALGDGRDGTDASKLSVSGEGVDSRSGSRRGSKDLGGKGRGKDDWWRRSSDDRNKGSRNLNKLDKKSDWDSKDGSAHAEEDDYFKKNNELESLTPFLPNILDSGDSNRGSSSLVQESLGDLLSDLVDKENESKKRNLNRKPSATLEGERDRVPRLRPLTDLTANSNQITKLPDIVNNQLYSQKALASTAWMDGDGSGSAHTTRFELPMDMKTLERMSPIEYLQKHCIISKRRMAHCKKIFIKQDKDKDAQINRDEVVSGLTEAHHNCITADQANSVLELVQMADEAHVDGKLFAALCCLTERALNLNYLPLSRKEVIEVVDFEALDWKLRDCHISNSLRTLFTQL